MLIRRRLKLPAIALIAALTLTVFLVACGGAEEPAAPVQQAPATAAPQVQTPTNTPAVRATNTPVVTGALPTPTQRASVLESTPRPTAPPVQQEGELVSERLIVVLDPPSLESMLDCEVTVSGVVNYRMSMEFMIDANRYDGEYEPTLATEWSVSDDGMIWNFKLRQGARRLTTGASSPPRTCNILLPTTPIPIVALPTRTISGPTRVRLWTS